MLLLVAALASVLLPAAEFNRDIRPILSDRCFSCHGPDSVNRQAGLRLDQEASAKSKLRSNNTAIVPRDLAQSELWKRITTDKTALRMPPAYSGREALTDNEIALIREWIEQGAEWQKHWSFIPPVRAAAPAVKQTARVRNPIDAFILNKLEQQGLKPSEEASKYILIRRLSLDLTGLPPTPSEVSSFVNDTDPAAYERVVDRLLASPRYAERMAIRWLEAARYADTNGYQSDGERSMWRWRDWVLNAFQRNMPFDQFTIQQIAGDLLPSATLEQKIASGFHRNHRTNAEGGIVEEEFRVEYVADRVETTSTVWLGLTLGCARCHDHKYDPLAQKDFYQMFAFFNNTPDRGLVYNFGNEEPFLQAPTPEHLRVRAELSEKVTAAERKWTGLAEKIKKTQKSWEKEIAKSEIGTWDVPDGHVVTWKLDESDKLPVVAGKIGNAIRLDGSNRFEAESATAKFDYKDPFSFAAWIKPEAENGTILSKSEDYWEGEGHQWFLHEGKLRLHITRRFTDISLQLETKTKVKLNEWQHVAITYDGYRKGAGVHIYVDGQPQPINILFDELTYPLGPKEPWRIGSGPGPKYNFRGAIDDVRIFKIALSPEQISTLPLLQKMGEIARIPEKQRSGAQNNKLHLCFLATAAGSDIKEAQASLEKAHTEYRKYDESIPTVMVMKEQPGIRDSFILKRGAYDAHGDKVTASTPSALPGLRPDWPRNRLGLAQWLVDRGNPLTARVAVNRYWQMLFGTGLVKTVEDFGSQGEWPIHGELLDWLAVEFMDQGWNTKGILKTIVMSTTYRQSSRLTQELLQKDPENRLLARGPRLRLSAEMVRDQALLASGLLVEKMGGPSVKPYQPPGLWQELMGGRGYVADKGQGLYRRSLYTYWKRTVAPPSMITFDSPTRESCMVRESRTNTPLQALNLMNDVTYLEASRKLAERLLSEGGATGGDRIRYGFRLVLSREPKPDETQVMAKLLDQFSSKYSANEAEAKSFLQQGESPVDSKYDPKVLAAYTSIASLLLNLDEAVTKE